MSEFLGQACVADDFVAYFEGRYAQKHQGVDGETPVEHPPPEPLRFMFMGRYNDSHFNRNVFNKCDTFTLYKSENDKIETFEDNFAKCFPRPFNFGDIRENERMLSRTAPTGSYDIEKGIISMTSHVGLAALGLFAAQGIRKCPGYDGEGGFGFNQLCYWPYCQPKLNHRSIMLNKEFYHSKNNKSLVLMFFSSKDHKAELTSISVIPYMAVPNKNLPETFQDYLEMDNMDENQSMHSFDFLGDPVAVRVTFESVLNAIQTISVSTMIEKYSDYV